VIAFTLTFVDEGAEDGVKTYRLREDGNIDIDYTFSINEELESHRQTGIVQPDQSNAKWRLKYNWLLSFDYYLIVELDPEYHLHSHRSTKQELCLDHVEEEEDG